MSWLRRVWLPVAILLSGIGLVADGAVRERTIVPGVIAIVFSTVVLILRLPAIARRADQIGTSSVGAWLVFVGMAVFGVIAILISVHRQSVPLLVLAIVIEASAVFVLVAGIVRRLPGRSR